MAPESGISTKHFPYLNIAHFDRGFASVQIKGLLKDSLTFTECAHNDVNVIQIDVLMT
uniref:Transposase n=1 Tax=Rhabditophanes sp. KR3021 TaxID=114890 RepID=A0AC35UB49_9BILA